MIIKVKKYVYSFIILHNNVQKLSKSISSNKYAEVNDMEARCLQALKIATKNNDAIWISNSQQKTVFTVANHKSNVIAMLKMVVENQGGRWGMLCKEADEKLAINFSSLVSIQKGNSNYKFSSGCNASIYTQEFRTGFEDLGPYY